VNISLKLFHFDTLGSMILEDDFRRQFDAIIATVPKIVHPPSEAIRRAGFPATIPEQISKTKGR
jgi:hypothetical protein